MSYDIRKVKLKDISIGKGSYGIGASAVDYDSKIPTYLRITDIDDFGTIDFENLKSVDDEKAGQYYLKENDIVFARTGASTGRAYFYEKKHGNFVYAGFLIKFSLNPDMVVPKYMKYYTLSDTYKNWVKAFTGGSTRGNINANTYGDMVVNLPSLEQQKYLVDILSSLDDKIELNNKINKNLEELAQTLYKHWFVDFEFPNEEGLPYKSSGGKMVESELGLIPEGWNVEYLNNLFNFVGGSQPPKKEHIYEYKEGYVRFIQNRDYSGNNNHLTFIKESTRNKVCNKYDIMMDKYGEAGKVRFGIEGAYNVALAKIDTDLKYREFLRRYFEQKQIQNYILNSSQASTRPSVNASVFVNLKVVIPSNNLLEKFDKVSFDIIKKNLLIKEENFKLEKLRDLLLPKLMSGEIRVPIKE